MRHNFLTVGVVFLLTRLVLLPFPQPASDVGIYAHYAQEYQAAARQGVSFYDFHARVVEQQIAAAGLAGAPRQALAEYKDVEYPPLALAFMRLVGLGLRGTTPDGDLRAGFVEEYRVAFRLTLAVVDVLLAGLVVCLVKWLYAGAPGNEPTLRALLYVASTALLWPLLYDRLDLLLAALVMLALLLLYSRLHYAWSFALLAVAINFKVVPLVLAPVWIVGALPGDARLSLRKPRDLAALVIRSAVLAALVVGCFLPFYLAQGGHCLDFLAYHRARGLEFESLYGSLLLALRPWQQALEVRYSYGSINLHSPLSPFLAALAPWLMLGLLLAASALVLVHGLRLGKQSLRRVPRSGRLVHLNPQAFACYTLLLFMLYIASNKVFSPQYLLWLAPLAALIPFHGWRRRFFLWGFLLTCGLSTILVPFLLSDLIAKSSAQPPSFWIFQEPTLRMTVLLELRNVLFLALLSALAVHLIRQVRRPLKETSPAS